MFRWHQEMERLNIPASHVLHLERSLSMVQVALPGLPSQEATAYLCVFAAGKGVRVALALHLHTSHRLAFYLHEQEPAPAQQADRLIEEGVLFAESMGFTLSDMDYRMLARDRRDALWGALPLRDGAEIPSPSVAVSPAESIGTSAVSVEAIPPADSRRRSRASLVETIIELAEEAPPEPTISDSKKTDAVTDSGMPFRTGTRNRAPSAEELSARRQNLLENLGRFFASL